MYPYYQDPYSYPNQFVHQQQQSVSQFVEINSENEIGTRLMPRDGTPVFYRIKGTQDVYQCAFQNGQQCITAYSLTPKINVSQAPQQQPQKQEQEQQSADLATVVNQLSQRLAHVEKYLQDLTAGGNNGTVQTATDNTVRSVTATIA